MLKKASLLTRPSLARRDAPCPWQARSSEADPRFTFHASRFTAPVSDARTMLAGFFSILLDAPRPPAHLSQRLFDMVTDVVIRLACQHGQQRRNHGGTESSQSVGGFRSRHHMAERIHERGYGRLVSDRAQRSDSRAQCQYFFIPPIAAAVERPRDLRSVHSLKYVDQHRHRTTIADPAQRLNRQRTEPRFFHRRHEELHSARIADLTKRADCILANRPVPVTKHRDQRSHSPGVPKRAKHRGGLFANRPILVFESSDLFGYCVSHIFLQPASSFGRNLPTGQIGLCRQEACPPWRCRP